MSKGGTTSTTWTSGSSWQSGETKVIRIPVAIADEVMRYARLIDAGNAVLHGNTGDRSIPAALETEIILGAIKAYIELKRQSYHPNQYSQALDISTRSWDEMRKFTAMVRREPQKLGLKNE